MNNPAKQSIGLGIVLMTLWAGLSGKFTFFMLSLGLISAVAVVLIVRRMEAIDREHYPARITILLLRFWLFLSREIIIANIDVVRRIFGHGKNISPQLFELPLKLRTDLSRVIYANAITMTPGTVSVNVNRDTITVHALSSEAMDDLCSGRMESHVPEDRENEQT